MYVPKANEEKSISTMHRVIKSRPLGIWSVLDNGSMLVNHIPFLLEESRGELGTLTGHVARSNDVWRRMDSDLETIVVFQGEQAYISPSWYPSKKDHGKVVPTWNYVAVHVHGRPRPIEDRGWLLSHLRKLTDLHERKQKEPWSLEDAPNSFIDRLASSVVGIEIPIDSLSGKSKLGQNRSILDKLGLIQGLGSIDNDDTQGLAKRLMDHVNLDGS